MADALIRLISQDLMSNGFIAAGQSAEQLEGRLVELTTGLESTSSGAAEGEKSLIDYGISLIGVKEIAVAAVAGVVALADAFKDQSLEAQKLATMAGTTVEAFSTIAGAAEDLGMSGQTVQHSLVLMQRGMQATGEAGEAFKTSLGSLGVEISGFQNSATGTTDLLLKLQETFSKMPDGPEKTAAALKVFGRGGAEMLEFFNQETGALKANMDAFSDLTLTITKADVEISRSIRGVINDLKDIGEATVLAIGRSMAPTFLAAMTEIQAAADTALHAVVDQFGGMAGATKALTESLEVLKPAIAAIQPVASTAFDVFRGFSFVFVELASVVALAASGFYKLEAATAWLFGNDVAVDSFMESADQAAALSERVDALAKSMVGLGEESAVAGTKMRTQAKAADDLTTVMKQNADETAKAFKEQDDAAKKAVKAKDDVIKKEREHVDVAKQVVEVKKEETKAVQEQVPWWQQVTDSAKGAKNEYLDQLAAIGNVNAGIEKMAAALAAAKAEAEALTSEILDSVNAQFQAGSQVAGGAGGGIQVGDRFIPHPQQGLPGAAGLSAVHSFQAEVANAQAFAEAERRQREQTVIAEQSRRFSEQQAQRLEARRAEVEKLNARPEDIGDQRGTAPTFDQPRVTGRVSRGGGSPSTIETQAPQQVSLSGRTLDELAGRLAGAVQLTPINMDGQRVSGILQPHTSKIVRRTPLPTRRVSPEA